MCPRRMTLRAAKPPVHTCRIWSCILVVTQSREAGNKRHTCWKKGCRSARCAVMRFPGSGSSSSASRSQGQAAGLVPRRGALLLHDLREARLGRVLRPRLRAQASCQSDWPSNVQHQNTQTLVRRVSLLVLATICGYMTISLVCNPTAPAVHCQNAFRLGVATVA